MPKLIGLGGGLRAGKDTVGDWLEEKHDFVKVGFSDALNEAMLKLNPYILTDYPVRIGYLRTTTWEPVRYQTLHDAVGYVEAKKHSEVRRFLQMLGTEVGRDMIDPDVWVNILEKRIMELLAEGKSVAITNVRFPNEIAMVRRLGGVTWYVARSASKRFEGTSEAGVPGSAESGSEGPSSAIASHASETSVTSAEFDRVLSNDGELHELYEKVEASLPMARDAFAVGGRIGSRLDISAGASIKTGTITANSLAVCRIYPPYDR